MDVLAKESHSNDLTGYLYKQYKEKNMCDVDLISCTGHSFSAHKLVLGACSAYLHKMFMKNENVYTLRLDLSQVVLEMLLEFSYTGQLFLSEKIHTQLKAAATYLEMYSVLDLLKSKGELISNVSSSEPTTVTQDIETLPHHSPIHGNQQRTLWKDSPIYGNQDSTQLKDSPIQGNQHSSQLQDLPAQGNQQSSQLKVLPIQGNQHSTQLNDSPIQGNQHSTQSKVLPIQGNQHITQLKDSPIQEYQHSTQLKDSQIQGNQQSTHIKVLSIHGNQNSTLIKYETLKEKCIYNAGVSTSELEIQRNKSSEELYQTMTQDTVKQVSKTKQSAGLVSSEMAEVSQPQPESKVAGQEKGDESMLPVRQSARIRKRKLQEDKTSVNLVKGKRSKTKVENTFTSNVNGKIELESPMKKGRQKSNNLENAGIFSERRKIREANNIQYKRPIVSVVNKKVHSESNSTSSSYHSNNNCHTRNARGKIDKPVRDVFVPKQNSCKCIACDLECSSYFHLHKHKLKWHNEKLARCIAGKYLLKRELSQHYLYEALVKTRTRKNYSCVKCKMRFLHYSLYRLHYVRHHYTSTFLPTLIQYCSKHLKLCSVKRSNYLNVTNVKRKENGKVLLPKTVHKLDGTVDVGQETELDSGHVTLLSPDNTLDGISTMNSDTESSKRSANTTLSSVSAIKSPKKSANKTLSSESEIKSLKTSPNTTLSSESATKPLKTSPHTTLSSERAIKSTESCIKGEPKTIVLSFQPISINAPVRKRPDNDGVFECPDLQCRRRLISQYAIFKHLRFVHKLPVDDARRQQFNVQHKLPCEVDTCDFSFVNLVDMQSHVKSQHPSIQHNCTQCKAQFQVGLLLQRHVAMSHGYRSIAPKKHDCPSCEKTFPKLQALRRHEYWKHDIHHPSVKIYECTHPNCTYKTSVSTSIKAHASKHQQDKPYTCDHCGMKLKTHISHRKHVAKMHLGIRPYLCQICGINFGEEHELKSHFLSRHTEEREFQCEYCPYATSIKGTFYTHLFNAHKVQAEGDKREIFKCPHCPYMSILHHRYKTHINNHTGIREFHCNLCDKEFTSSAVLRSHYQWKHSDTTYSCTQCDYQTKTKTKLSEHIQVQHLLKGFFPYKCTYCDFKCATAGNTRKHIKQVHKNAEVKYIKDDGMLAAARIARASGQHSSLAEIVSVEEPVTQVNKIDTCVEGGSLTVGNTVEVQTNLG